MHFILGIIGVVILSFLVGLVLFKNVKDEKERLRKGILTTIFGSIIFIAIIGYLLFKSDNDRIASSEIESCIGYNSKINIEEILGSWRRSDSDSNIFEFDSKGMVSAIDIATREKYTSTYEIQYGNIIINYQKKRIIWKVCDITKNQLVYRL